MLLFLLVFFIVYGLANWYITSRIFSLVPFRGPWKVLARPLWIALLLAFPAGRLCTTLCRTALADWMLRVGSWYLGIMVYSFFFFAVNDLWHLSVRLLPFLKNPDQKLNRRTRKNQGFGLFAAYALFIILVVVGGHYNAVRPTVRSYDLSLPGGNVGRTVRIALVSDIHAGLMVNNHWLHRIVNTINKTEPDVVLMAGDIVDGSVTHAQEERLSQVMAGLSAPLGVYAVLGNHEYYTDTEEVVPAIESGGVKVLLDEALTIDGLFTLAGRKDIQAERSGQGRKPLETILEGTADDLAVIVMDHTPVNLNEATEAGVALQVSGHTHRGQLFPFNVVTDMIFEQDWGFLRKKGSLFYVSCGVGTWGPPIRTSSRPEVVLFNITFRRQDAP